MYIPFLDLQRENRPYMDLIQQQVMSVMEKGRYILGEQVLSFEEKFADYCGVSHCIGVASGLDALSLIFRGYLELGRLHHGDEVILPSNTFIASALAITENNLEPVFADIKTDTYNLDPKAVESLITNKTKAILAVHLYGLISDFDELRTLAKKYNLLLIEDAAQAHGATYQNQRAGSLGNAAGFSFYPTKNLGAMGDAGAITTNDTSLATITRQLANYGKTGDGIYPYRGINSRLDELQAGILNIKLRYLDDINKNKQLIAKKYIQGLNNQIIDVSCTRNQKNHVYYQFVIKCERRNKLKDFLKKEKIDTQIHYPISICEQDSFIKSKKGTLENTCLIENKILSLPIFASLKDEEIHYIIETINKFDKY